MQREWNAIYLSGEMIIEMLTALTWRAAGTTIYGNT